MNFLGNRDADFEIKEQTINGLIYYFNATSNSNEIKHYISPQKKSDSIRVKSVLVNPTQYWAYPSLIKYDSDSDTQERVRYLSRP